MLCCVFSLPVWKSLCTVSLGAHATLSRASCAQEDDNEATVATAIDRYNQACEPLLDHFREAGLLSSIDTGALSSSSRQPVISSNRWNQSSVTTKFGCAGLCLADLTRAAFVRLSSGPVRGSLFALSLASTFFCRRRRCAILRSVSDSLVTSMMMLHDGSQLTSVVRCCRRDGVD